jgi:DNA-binding LytR/AlgR family response regulator
MEKKLLVKDSRGNGNTAYLPHQIICCEADKEYTTLYITTSEAPGWRKQKGLLPNLGCYEEWLNDYGFQRVSRELLINLDCVEDWQITGKDIFIVLKYSCFKKISVGPAYKEAFCRRMIINY